MNMNESNFTQELTLPSQGLLNPEIPEGKLVQRCMMVADQKFLSGSNRTPGSAIQKIIQRTVTSPESFDVGNLTLPDTLYLLFKLRILSYGKEYKFRTKCPECGKRIDVELDLSQLPVDTLEDNYKEKLCVILPNRGDTVYTKLLTNRETDEINNEIERRKRRNTEDNSEYILRIVYSIDRIVLSDSGKELTHPVDIEKYISALTDLDAATIISCRDSVAYGINPLVEYVCPKCNNYIDVSIQFSSEFFRPHISR